MRVDEMETANLQASQEAPFSPLSGGGRSGQQPEGPKNLSPPLPEQLPPKDEPQQHPQEPASHPGETVMCIDPQANVGELNDTGLTTERAAELRAVFGPNAVKAKQVGFSRRRDLARPTRLLCGTSA